MTIKPAEHLGQLTLAGDTALEESLARRAAELERALLEALELLEHPERPPAGIRVRALRAVAGVDPEAPATPRQRAEAGIARAEARWTTEEAEAVDRAIDRVALAALDDYLHAPIKDATGPTFTADDVWEELGDGFPVTKGLAGRLNFAVSQGRIANTGETTYSQRQGPHGHGQRLTVWRPR